MRLFRGYVGKRVAVLFFRRFAVSDDTFSFTTQERLQNAMVYVTRKCHFSASHRLYNPDWSDSRNDEIFDKCNNARGHGHNYVLEVTVAGQPDPETGYVIDLKKLRDILEEEIIDKVDHKHLNYDVDFLEGIIPTAENIAVMFWQIIERKLPSGKLHSVKLFESDNNFVEYFGDPVKIKRFAVSHEKAELV